MKIYPSQFLDTLLSYMPLQKLTGLWLFLSTGILSLETWLPGTIIQTESVQRLLEFRWVGLGLLLVLYLCAAYILVLNHLKISSSNPDEVRELLAVVFKAILN
ncbi:MAG: hypothetical protein LUQ11_06490, partial [Methylococcaceae bacterium]|nr:hypothetical protein [Methylococcaceae bacterium]